MLAPYIAEQFSCAGDLILTSRNDPHYPCDLTKPQEVSALIDEVFPGVVLHLAAMTNVDYCEEHPEEAIAANATTTRNLVTALAGSEAYFVYISTDQIYPDGEGPFCEEGSGPVNHYGKSKLAGELEAKKYMNSLIVRTNIIGPSRTSGRDSLSDFFIKAFSEKKQISLFKDVLFSPLHMATLAQVLLQCYEQDLRGTYNLGSHEGMSKKDFALKLAEQKGLDASQVTITDSTNIPGRAPRPRDLRLNVACFESMSGIKLPSLQEEIEKL